MARALTKIGPGGTPYVRPPGVEAQIDEAIQLTHRELRSRLLVTDREDTAYLKSECLVHLVRLGLRSGDQSLMNAVLPVLLRRCEVNLLKKIPDDAFRDAPSLRQDILDQLADLFATDGTGPNPDRLDFYECRFNRSLRSLRIDAVRRDVRRSELEGVPVDLPKSVATDGTDTDEDALARVAEAFRILPTQEWGAYREPFLRAIEALPAEEREAVILVHVLGYKEESDDPETKTAATLCGCRGRTIRNRLTRAATKLSRFKEDL